MQKYEKKAVASGSKVSGFNVLNEKPKVLYTAPFCMCVCLNDFDLVY